MTEKAGKPREVVGPPTSAEYTPPPQKREPKKSKDQEASTSDTEE